MTRTQELVLLIKVTEANERHAAQQYGYGPKNPYYATLNALWEEAHQMNIVDEIIKEVTRQDRAA